MNDTITTVELAESRRTEYRDGGVLSASALAGDAAANIAAWEKHQATAHIGGIVAGLFVSIVKPDPPPKSTPPTMGGSDELFPLMLNVTPGAAIDSQGHMLLVGVECFPELEDLTPDTDQYAVWLRNGLELIRTGTSELRRYQETTLVEIQPLPNSSGDCQEDPPMGVMLAILRVEKKKVDGQPKETREWKVDGCCRRFVGAVGNRIDSPSGRARVVLGPQFPRDPRRFAIGVQAAAPQPIRDVFTWESTGTIRLSTRTSVALPHEKEKPDEVEQPPIMVVGAPTVYFTPEDFLDPCQVWARLIIRGEDGKEVIPSELLDPLSDGDRIALATRPACRVTVQALLLRSLNRLIRKAADNVLDLVTRRKFEPAAQTIVVDESGNEFTVTNVDFDTKTFDIVGTNGTPQNGVGWQGFWPRDWSPAVFLTDRKLPEKLPEKLRMMLSRWRVLPGDYLCRILLDNFLGDAIKPLESPAPRGLYFNGTVPIEQEPQASRIHLVEFKKDGQTFRQLRITIPDPGKENNPHRYRCSIGTAPDCIDPAAPAPTEKNWNRQTSWPRGILSVLADKSIDIHDQLNVYPSEGSILPGLILKLEPDSDSDAGTGTSGGAAGGASIPAAQILGNAVIWDGQRVNRLSRTELVIGGTLRNLTDLPVEKLKVLVSIYGKGDTNHGPQHTEVVSDGALGRRPSAIGLTTLAQDVNVPISETFKAVTIVVSLLVMGVNSQNFIICTQYIEELPAPAA